MQLSGLSSTRRIRRGVIADSAALGAGASVSALVAAQISNAATNENTLPSPTTLSSQMRPPISSTRRLQIVSPSPDPPNRRVVDESACVNRSNTLLMFSCAMPMPLSVTVNRSAVGAAGLPSSVTRSDTSPVVVNLIALPSKLRST